MRRATEDDRRRIVEEYRSGASTYQLAERWGLVNSTVWRIVARAGIPRRARWTKGIRCLDCDALSYPARRCAYHRKIRNAELNREIQRERKGVRREYA